MRVASISLMISMIVLVSAFAEEDPVASADAERVQREQQAHQVTTWQQELEQEIAAMREELAKAPAVIAEAMKRFVAAKEQMVSALKEKAAAYLSAEEPAAKAAEEHLAVAQEEHELREIDMQEAVVLSEVQQRIVESGQDEELQGLVEEVKATFAEQRELREQIKALEQKMKGLHARREIILRKIELAKMRKEIETLEQQALSE